MKLIQTNDNNLKELIKGSSSAFILKIAGMLFSYASMLFITRFYGAEEWGLYSLGFTVLSIAVVIPVFGFDNALIRLIAEINQKSKNTSIVSVLLKASLVTVILSLVVILSIDYFSDFITHCFFERFSLHFLIH